MSGTKFSYLTNSKSYRSTWWDFNLILSAIHRKAELEDLIVWARQKKLSKIKQTYISRLCDEENRLVLYRHRLPHLFLLARFARWVHTLVSSEPTYTKGYAAKYRIGYI